MKTLTSHHLRPVSVRALLLGAMLGTAASFAAPPLSLDQAAFLKNVQPASAAKAALAPQTTLQEASRYSLKKDGFLEYIGAPPDYHFPATLSGPVLPHAVAMDFLRQHQRHFMSASKAAGFVHHQTTPDAERSYVKLAQVYDNVPIYGAQAVVQVDLAGGIECVLATLLSDLQELEAKRVPTKPVLSGAEATARAIADALSTHPNILPLPSPAELNLFAPGLLKAPGKLCLTWAVRLLTTNGTLAQETLVDALNGEIVHRFSLAAQDNQFQIFDAALCNAEMEDEGWCSPTLRRTSSDPPTGNRDIDYALDFAMNCEAYFANRYNFNDITDLDVFLNWCPSSSECPWANAVATEYRRHWDSVSATDRINMGWQFVELDIFGHEFTHRVTRHTSNLAYEYESGAINESMSDIFGTFIRWHFWGNAQPWLFGYSLPTRLLICRRDMQYPTNSPQGHQPDRLNSPYYQHDTNDNDSGGVHQNSGVGNKLCYLLTDGDTFNGQVIWGLGADNVERLYWEADTRLLGRNSGWSSLASALLQATYNLHWVAESKRNVYKACLAVEIAPGLAVVYVDNSGIPHIPDGSLAFPYTTVIDGWTDTAKGGTLNIHAGHYPEIITFDRPATVTSYGGAAVIGE